MTYERINFVDQSVERPRTYEMTHNADGSITLTDSFGLVNELGTPINADTMNHIEDGIDSKQDQLIAGDNIILENNVISAKSGAMPIGTIIPVNASSTYVPDGTLPCDGAEYTKAQFGDLWDNYLIGEEKTVAVPADFLDLTGLTVSENGEVIGFNSNNQLEINISGETLTKITYVISMTDVTTSQTLINVGDSLDYDKLFVYNGSLIYKNPNNEETVICSVSTNIKYKLVFQWNSSNSNYTLTVYQDGTMLGSVITDYLPVTYNTNVLRDFGYSFTSGTLYLLESQAVASANWYYFATSKTVMNSLLNTCTYSDYEADLTTYGQCAKFAVDVDNETFRVPFSKDGAVVQQALSDSELGKSYNANISIPNTSWTGNGVKPSKSNAGEANSLIVASGVVEGTETLESLNYTEQIANITDFTNNAVALRYFVVVANGQTNQSMMDWSAWASSLQGKANADLSNCTSPIVSAPYIVEVSDKSILPSWYRVWSDGWCEQGGHLGTESATKYTVSFLKEFVDTNYSLVATDSTGVNTNSDTSGATAAIYLGSYTTSSFYVSIDGGRQNSSWVAKGYIS